VDRVERSGVSCWNRKRLKVKVLSAVLYYSDPNKYPKGPKENLLRRIEADHPKKQS